MTEEIDTQKPDGEAVGPASDCSLSFEEVTLDELSARYLRILNVDRKQGYGAQTPENHFQLALLYMTTGRYEAVEGEHGQRYRIPDWSDFTEASIKAMEAGLSENDLAQTRRAGD